MRWKIAESRISQSLKSCLPCRLTKQTVSQLTIGVMEASKLNKAAEALVKAAVAGT